MKPQTDKHTVVGTNKLYYKIFFFLDVMVKVPVLSPSQPMSLVIPVPTPPSILRFTMDVSPRAPPQQRSLFLPGSCREAVINSGSQEYLTHLRDSNLNQPVQNHHHQRAPPCQRPGYPSPLPLEPLQPPAP